MRYIFISLFMSAGVFRASVLWSECTRANAASSNFRSKAAGEQEIAPADKRLEIWIFIDDDYRVITARTLHLTVQVLWKLGITVNLEGLIKSTSLHAGLKVWRLESAKSLITNMITS